MIFINIKQDTCIIRHCPRSLNLQESLRAYFRLPNAAIKLTWIHFTRPINVFLQNRQQFLIIDSNLH